MNGTGHPNDVFCGWQPPHLKHEVLGTEFCLAYWGATFIRGFDVDQTILPDIEMHTEKELFYVELDTGSVPYRRQEVRWRKYDNFQGVVLVVTLSESRLRGLMTLGFDALYTTLDRVQNDPHGPIWFDPNGDLFSIDVQ